MTEKEYLASYDPKKYFRPSVRIDTILFTVKDIENKNYRKLPEKKLQVLLMKREGHPFKDRWVLPGTFMKEEETFHDAIHRCLKDKANIEDIYLEQLFTWGEPNRDPRTRVISTSYMGLIDTKNLKVKAGKMVKELEWFSVRLEIINEFRVKKEEGYQKEEEILLILENRDTILKNRVKVIKRFVEGNLSTDTEILESDLAFDHARIIMYAIERLRNKLEYTTIAFNLMPEQFTLSKLQQVYEIILDKKLLKANFRRKIAEMVIETQAFEKNAGHRPSRLFEFNKSYQNATNL